MNDVHYLTLFLELEGAVHRGYRIRRVTAPPNYQTNLHWSQLVCLNLYKLDVEDLMKSISNSKDSKISKKVQWIL